MDLNQTVTITYGKDGKGKAEIPLKNFLRLSLVYILPLIDQHFVDLSSKGVNAKEYAVRKEVWNQIFLSIKDQLGIPEGGKVLL